MDESQRTQVADATFRDLCWLYMSYAFIGHSVDVCVYDMIGYMIVYTWIHLSLSLSRSFSHSHACVGGTSAMRPLSWQRLAVALLLWRRCPDIGVAGVAAVDILLSLFWGAAYICILQIVQITTAHTNNCWVRLLPFQPEWSMASGFRTWQNLTSDMVVTLLGCAQRGVGMSWTTETLPDASSCCSKDSISLVNWSMSSWPIFGKGIERNPTWTIHVSYLHCLKWLKRIPSFASVSFKFQLQRQRKTKFKNGPNIDERPKTVQKPANINMFSMIFVCSHSFQGLFSGLLF